MLRAELHNHSKEDPYDGRGTYKVQYSARELIQHAAKQGTKVLSLTLHGKVWYPKTLQDYAKSKGVLLISGVELWPSGPHMLVWGISEEERKRLRSLPDLAQVKDHAVICAAHPFYGIHSIGLRFSQHAENYHALEYTHAYTRGTKQLNQLAGHMARKHRKTLIGTSDTHFLPEMGYTYSEIDAHPKRNDVLEALRNPQRVRVVSRPMPLLLAGKVLAWHALDNIRFPKRA